MERYGVFTAALMLAVVTEGAFAACTGTRLTSPQISQALSGKYVCGILDTEKWHELHQGSGGGGLVDYKMGPDDAIDPSGPVGTWSIVTGTGGVADKVRYDYGSGGTYDYEVWTSDALGSPEGSAVVNVTFCGAKTIDAAISSSHFSTAPDSC